MAASFPGASGLSRLSKWSVLDAAPTEQDSGSTRQECVSTTDDFFFLVDRSFFSYLAMHGCFLTTYPGKQVTSLVKPVISALYIPCA